MDVLGKGGGVLTQKLLLELTKDTAQRLAFTVWIMQVS
jgi:hypothetical protein